MIDLLGHGLVSIFLKTTIDIMALLEATAGG